MATYKDVLMLVDKVSEPLRKIQATTEKTQKSFKGLGGKLTKVGENMKTVGGKITSTVTKITATLAAFAAGTVFAMKKAAEYGNRIDKMSQKIGMSRKSFQEWDYIMSQNGGNVETLQMGFKTLVTQIEGVQKGSKDSVKAFKALGVNVKDSNGHFRVADDVFNDVIRKLQQIKDPTQKMILANRLFGRSAAELRPLLNQEASAIDELREKANKMGLILSEQDVKNAVKFSDTMDTFSRVFQAKFATIVMKLMPKFSEIMEKILSKTDTIEKIMGYLFKLVEVFINLVDWFVKLDNRWKVVIVSAGAFLAILGPIITGIGSLIITIGGINTALGLLATAIGTTKTALLASSAAFMGWVAVFAGIAAGIWAVIKAIQVLIDWIKHLNRMKINNLATDSLSPEALNKLRAKRKQMGAKKFDAAYPDIARQIKQADNGGGNSKITQTQNNTSKNSKTIITYNKGGQSTMQNKPKFNPAFVVSH